MHSLKVIAIMAALGSAPSARVLPHGVDFLDECALTVRVPETAAYVGGEQFVLHDAANAEVQLFVDADRQHRIHRIFWIQRESYLPTRPDMHYNYARDNIRASLAGTTTWLRASPAVSTDTTHVGSDREHVIAILRRAGYEIPAEVLSVRLVQLLDDPQSTGQGRDELMLMYSEDLAPQGITVEELTKDGPSGSRWKAIEPTLIERALKAFTVARK